MNNRRRPPFIAFRFFPLFIVAAILIFGGVVMLLWNAILPDVLHVTQISYWQAVGLLVLCRILFGFRGGGPGRFNHGRGPWRQKWMNMSEDEKAKLRAAWKSRCEPPTGQP